MNAVNIPLMALFGLAYGLGHPSLASWRPHSVDKTLSSFHNDINRTAADMREGAKTLLLARSQFSSAAAAQGVAEAAPAGKKAVVIAVQKSGASMPVGAMPAHLASGQRQRESLREPPRDMRERFTAPPGR